MRIYARLLVSALAAATIALASTLPASAGTWVNLALGQSVTASCAHPSYPAVNATDGNPYTYWESCQGFPQTLLIDLGSSSTLHQVVFKLPPLPQWGTRTQSISVETSNDNINFISAPAGFGNPSPIDYIFDPATGNTATLSMGSHFVGRYIRVTFLSNTGGNAAQASEVEVLRYDS
jgi:hypothetical protein